MNLLLYTFDYKGFAPHAILVCGRRVELGGMKHTIGKHLSRAWNSLPSRVQATCSRCAGRLLRTAVSRHLVTPYGKLNGLVTACDGRFRPLSGNRRYTSFNDFFCRRLVRPAAPAVEPCWPCDGRVVDHRSAGDAQHTRVKGDSEAIANIFHPRATPLEADETFINIFLANHDYHWVHAPVSGTITRLTDVPGALLVLRSWCYGRSVNHPSLHNTRLNVEITCARGHVWHLSMVAGPGVGAIQLDADIRPGAAVSAGTPLAYFRLGSTCCMIAPIAIARPTRVTAATAAACADSGPVDEPSSCPARG